MIPNIVISRLYWPVITFSYIITEAKRKSSYIILTQNILTIILF
jgi:hypothetical protein